MDKYFIDQINVSDVEYKILDLNLQLNSVKKGDLLFSYESSKATFEVVAENKGNVYFNPIVKVGGIYKVGVLIALVTPENLSKEKLEELFSDQDVLVKSDPPIGNQIITQKALRLIEMHGIQKGVFEGVPIVSEDLVLKHLTSKKYNKDFQEISYYLSDNKISIFEKKVKKLAVVGAGKAALQVFDAVLSAQSYEVVLLYDGDIKLKDKKLLGVPIRNTLIIDEIYSDFKLGLFDEIIISFSGNIQRRKEIFDEILLKEIPVANVIHPTALLSNHTKIGVGNLIFANTRIGPFSEIGDNNVLSSYCNIEHHNSLGSHNTFGPGVVFSGSCSIGHLNRFGTGIYIEPNVRIGSNSVISSGVILTKHVPDNCLVRNLSKFEFKNI